MPEYDPTKVRVRDGWCVVLMDKRKTELDSGLVLPTELGIEKVDSGMATIIRVGEGKKNAILGLEKGQRVALRSFLKYANPIPNGEGREYFIMSSDDIAMICPPGVEVGVLSAPATSSIKESP